MRLARITLTPRFTDFFTDFELHSIRYRILVIALNFCCIYIGLVFIKDRPVSSFWVLRFRSRVLRFRDLGASFSSFGCFVLRSSFSSASFSKLPYCFTHSDLFKTTPPKHFHHKVTNTEFIDVRTFPTHAFSCASPC